MFEVNEDGDDQLPSGSFRVEKNRSLKPITSRASATFVMRGARLSQLAPNFLKLPL